MAPKDKKKKAKEPPPPPSVWCPATPKNKDWVVCDLGICTDLSLRLGSHAVVRGKEALVAGRFRLIYEVTKSTSPAGYGMLIGVCSCANTEPEVQASKQIHDIFHKPNLDGFTHYGHTSAWALSPSTGRLVTTHDLGRGVYDGATQGKELMPVPTTSKRNAEGMSIVVEVRLPSYTDEHQATIAQRTFSRTLHPLLMRHSDALEEGQRSVKLDSQKGPAMAFSIDGGPMVDAGVPVMPAALYPWVMLGREGDVVTLSSIEKLEEL